MPTEIMSYSTDPLRHMRFLGSPTNSRYFGVELETSLTSVNGHVNRDQKARSIVNGLGQDFVMAKHDSTIGYGFELVTAPASLDVHRERWARFFDDHTDSLQNDHGPCGMHVHVTRESFSNETRGKVMFFVHRRTNRRFIVTVSGRPSSRWARLIGAWTPERNESDTRYEAINTRKSGTVEFRIFNGTLDRNRFFSNLEFCQAVIAFCECHEGPEQITHKVFSAWVHARFEQYPHLCEFLTANGYPAPVVRERQARVRRTPQVEVQSVTTLRLSPEHRDSRQFTIFGLNECEVIRAMFTAGMTVDQIQRVARAMGTVYTRSSIVRIQERMGNPRNRVASLTTEQQAAIMAAAA